MKITVFGGSQPKVGEPAYTEAYHLGELIGRLGWTVLTGGYIGTMEAVSRGAAEHGGHVIGVTCEEIERWRPVKANAWVMEERRYATLRERLNGLIDPCDAMIALPGGVGTLTELTLTWNQLLVNAIPPRPLIALGQGWKAVLDSFLTEMDAYIPPAQRGWVRFAQTADEAVALLRESA